MKLPAKIWPIFLTPAIRNCKNICFGKSARRTSRGVNLDLTGHFRTLGMEHSVLLGGDYYAWEAKDSGYTNNFSAIGRPIDIYNPV